MLLGQVCHASQMIFEEYLLKDMVGRGQRDTTELRSAIKQDLINRELIIQEVRRIGLDKSPEAQLQMEVLQQNVLIQLFLQNQLRQTPINDEVLRKDYDEIRSKISPDAREYKTRHILVKEEAEAKAVIAELARGGNFDKIAADRSLDTGSKGNGGDLGWSSPQNFVAPFAEALVKLKKGETSGTPVQTQFGWHVIRLDDVRDAQLPKLDELKQQIGQQLQQQKLMKFQEDLRAKAKIE